MIASLDKKHRETQNLTGHADGQHSRRAVTITALCASIIDSRIGFFQRQLRTSQCGGCIELAIALLQQSQVRITDAAAATGLCGRQLEYRFQATTSSSQVRFRRLAHLQRGLRALLLASPDRSLMFLPDSAYVDQAQQTHEFRALTSSSEMRRARRVCVFLQCAMAALANTRCSTHSDRTRQRTPVTRPATRIDRTSIRSRNRSDASA